MSDVVSFKAARVDRRIEELRALDNIHSVHLMYCLPCGAAIVGVVPYPSEGSSGEDWGSPTSHFRSTSIQTWKARASGQN